MWDHFYNAPVTALTFDWGKRLDVWDVWDVWESVDPFHCFFRLTENEIQVVCINRCKNFDYI